MPDSNRLPTVRARADACPRARKADTGGDDWSVLPDGACSRAGFSLDLSGKKLVGMQGICLVQSLTQVDLSVNRFKRVPPELAQLSRLATLDMSRNFLRPTLESLLIPDLAQLSELRLLDLRFNERCGKPDLLEMLAVELPAVSVRITLWGQIVGASPASRDATLLRSQLEPWPTPVLRRRLVHDFGVAVEGIGEMGRGDVMEMLLDSYARQGVERQIVRVDGVPVRATLIDQLIVELCNWVDRQTNVQRERPSISAQHYMILRNPAACTRSDDSKKARRAESKLKQNVLLWDLAVLAITEADPEFAASFTALAVTHNFRGSPHIDKQNAGPFYGLAFGDFAEGEGGLCVECNARTVAQVNTRNRLAKVDGRFPHWVAPYDPDAKRYSLIYYKTDGEHMPPSTAFFTAADPPKVPP